MNKLNAQTLKGFRDFLPEQAANREFVIGKIKEVFKQFGFEPLETPALEYEEVLAGKYGDEGEKLMYRFTDNGDRRVAMRYDQTVPLARVVAQYPDIPKPFKRYQIQAVWRAENTQKGRYREFLQCDIDTVGSSSLLADAEIIAASLTVMKNLGFKNSFMEINDRTIFEELEPKYIATIDKLKKIGAESVIRELVERGLTKDEAPKLLDRIQNAKPTETIKMITYFLTELGFEEEKDFKFSPTLARGLDYYTGSIFELVSPDYESSLGGGGRYDKLIGQYSGLDTPAVGLAFGFDRLMEAMEELQLLPQTNQNTQVLVTVFNMELGEESLKVLRKLREAGIPSEIWLDANDKLDKQLKYADAKKISYAIIIGPDEAKEGKVTLKNLSEKTQETLTLEELLKKL